MLSLSAAGPACGTHPRSDAQLAAYAKLLNASPVPELPDITIYLDALNARVVGHTLTRIRITSPFLLRTAVPPISECEGRKVVALRRIGKRIAFGFENELWLVLHLMIAGRLHWRDRLGKLTGKQNLAAF